MECLDRYRTIIDNFSDFIDACSRPIGTTVRVNTVKSSIDQAVAVLESEGISVTQSPQYPPLLDVDTDTPGRTWASFHGLIYSQGEVSMLPARIIDPQAGDIVWDSCAAPGGKSTHLAALMDDAGTVIANDSNLGRLSSLRFNTERLGITSIAVTHQDGRNFSLKPFEFDTVNHALVDAPCSCEGTTRKNPGAVDGWTLEHVRAISGVQKGILRRAIQMTEPGGTVLYSTCTYAPEENEAVVDHALEHENCHLEPIDIDIDYSPGVLEWDEQTFDSSLEQTARLYPHITDTNGFYIAKIRVGPT